MIENVSFYFGADAARLYPSTTAVFTIVESNTGRIILATPEGERPLAWAFSSRELAEPYLKVFGAKFEIAEETTLGQLFQGAGCKPILLIESARDACLLEDLPEDYGVVKLRIRPTLAREQILAQYGNDRNVFILVNDENDQIQAIPIGPGQLADMVFLTKELAEESLRLNAPVRPYPISMHEVPIEKMASVPWVCVWFEDSLTRGRFFGIDDSPPPLLPVEECEGRFGFGLPKFSLN